MNGKINHITAVISYLFHLTFWKKLNIFSLPIFRTSQNHSTTNTGPTGLLQERVEARTQDDKNTGQSSLRDCIGDGFGTIGRLGG